MATNLGLAAIAPVLEELYPSADMTENIMRANPALALMNNKTTGGVDLTVFWNPVQQNLYRGLDFGVEYMHNRQQDEVLSGDDWVKRTYVRDGAFSWARYRLNRTWDFGAYYEDFELAEGSGSRSRVGGFLTWSVSSSA